MIPQAKEIEALATKFSKPQLQQMAQLGQIDPQTAVMAGMMIDRIMQSNMQPPQTTVAQDVMGAAVPQEAMGMAPPQMAPMAAPAGVGLDSLPVPDTMFDESSFAGGGIVAFSGGGDTSPFRRDFDAWVEAQRRSVSERTPGMVGAYKKPLVSPEEEERMRLRSMIEREYGPRGSLLQGYFMDQSPEQRQEAKEIVSKLPTMSLDEMRKLASKTSPVAAAQLSAQSYPDEGRRGTAAGLMPGMAKAAEDFGIGAPAGNVAGMAPAGAAPAGTAPAAKTATKAPASALGAWEEYQQLLEKAGVSKDPYAADREANAAAREALAKDREQAKYMAILQAGLGMMGGTSPRALENIAKGITPAVGEYAKTARDIKADEREIAKVDRDLRKANEALRRGEVDKFLDLRDKAETREIQRLAASKPTATGELLSAITGKDPARRDAALTVLGAGKTGALTEKSLLDNWNKLSLSEKINLRKQNVNTFAEYAALMRAQAGGGASTPTGRVYQFADIAPKP